MLYTDSDIARLLGKITVILAAAFLVPYLFLLIWNHIMPEVCGFQELTYWQSFFLGLGLRLINGSAGIKNRLDEN